MCREELAVGDALQGSQAQEPCPKGARRALVVDDEPDVREVLRRALVADGLACVTAGSGLEALGLLSSDGEGARATGRVDLILTDIKMPGMDGLELTRRIRSENEDCAVVVVTAVDDLARVREALRLGADEYLVKPFSIQQLRLACEQALERRRLSSELGRAQRARQELVDIIFHDLRNPLAVTRGYLSLMQAMPEAATPGDIAAAIEGCDATVNIIEEIADLGRIERSETAVRPERFRIEDVVLEVVEIWRPLAERAGKRIRAASSCDLPPVRADARLVRRVVSDLLAGAVKYASGKTPIVVELSVAPDGSEVRLAVVDDGLAVPPEMREAVFGKLRQGELRQASARRGQGVALPFAREACRCMGARVWVEDAKPDGAPLTAGNDGCRFVVAIPAASAAEDHRAARASAAACRERSDRPECLSSAVGVLRPETLPAGEQGA